MSPVSHTSFTSAAPAVRSQGGSGSASSDGGAQSVQERPFSEALRDCCEESSQQQPQPKSKATEAKSLKSTEDSAAEESTAGRSDSEQVAEDAESDADECCDGTAPAMHLSMPPLPQLIPAEFSAAPLLTESPVVAAEVAPVDSQVRVNQGTARGSMPNASEVARSSQAPVDPAAQLPGQPKVAATVTATTSTPVAESAALTADAVKSAASSAAVPAAVVPAAAKEIMAPVASAPAGTPAVASNSTTVAPATPTVEREENKLPTAEQKPAADRPERSAAANAAQPAALPPRERLTAAPGSPAAWVQSSAAGAQSESFAGLADGGERQSQQQSPQPGSDRFGFGTAKDGADSNRFEAGIAGKSLAAAPTGSDSQLQKAENVRVFIQRIESGVQQMKQQGASSLQMRITLEQGQVIRIRLNLRGTQLKTFIQTDSESIRSSLKEGWSGLSRILADQGVDANNPEFESDMNQSNGQNPEPEAAFDQLLNSRDLARAAGSVTTESPLAELPAQPLHNSLPKQSFSRIA